MNVLVFDQAKALLAGEKRDPRSIVLELSDYFGFEVKAFRPSSYETTWVFEVEGDVPDAELPEYLAMNRL